MKIITYETKKIEKEVDVEFPIYRIHRLGNSAIYTKIESIEKQISIHLYRDENKVEVEVEKPTFWGSKEYLFGMNGEHMLDEEEFIRAVSKMIEIINSI